VEQVLAPATEYLPASQDVQLVAPAAEYFPAVHEMQEPFE
jgi:hypothetical protein